MSSLGPDTSLPLSGIRIVDFGAGGIVPIATSYLADFGAEVIKVESYTAIDFVRRTDYFVDDARDPNMNIHFARYNQNKLSVLLNLKHPEGVTLAKRLVSAADVVIENLSLGTFARLGLDYEQLKEVKPDIIMVSASFAGQTGPYRGFRGQGFIIHALQGVNELTGWPDRWPVSPGGAFADHYLPWMWATVVLSALDYRSRTGKGQFIDASSFEGCLDILDTAIADYCVNGRALTRRGNRHDFGAPHGVYKCLGEDRWCAIAVLTDEEWKSFCRVLGNPTWTSEDRFSNLLRRQENLPELDQLVEEWTAGQSAETVMLKLQAAGVAASVVEDIKDLHHDAQLKHRGHFWDAEDPRLDAFTFEAPSAKLGRTPAYLQRRFPFMGEHSWQVYVELLGISPDEYNRLVEESVVA